ncbi:MAG: molecular chaperone DnaJ [Rhodospirillales bacterium]
MAQDFYQILGVTKTADAGQLKKAYRKLALELHPDRNPDDKEAERRFKEVNHAYDVLKDPEKRAMYDRFGAAAFDGSAGGPGAGQRGRGGGFDFGGFADIFDEMFGEFGGQRRGGGGQARGSDLRYNMAISLEEAFTGKETTVRVPGTASCEGCGGSGAEPGSSPKTCPTCNGRGRLRASQGFFTVERTCHTCQGEGRTLDKPCKVCSGEGRVHKDKTLQVNIPAGVEDGTRIRLSGEGEAGVRGATSGDLYIFLSIKDHAFFERGGADLQCMVPIQMTTATLGGSVEVPSIDGGRVKVTIPEGTQSGQSFRVRGKGMSVLRSRDRGDLYIAVKVETPVKLSRKQKEILREFEDAGDPSASSPESHGFFAKVRDFLDGLKN